MLTAVAALEEDTNYGLGLHIGEEVIDGYVVIDGPMNSEQLRIVADWLDEGDGD